MNVQRVWEIVSGWAWNFCQNYSWFYNAHLSTSTWASGYNGGSSRAQTSSPSLEDLPSKLAAVFPKSALLANLSYPITLVD